MNSEVIVYVVMGLVAVFCLVGAVLFLVEFFGTSTEEKKAKIVKFLEGLVAVAEIEFTGSGRGVEKLQEVEAQFKKTAPAFLRIVYTLCNVGTIEELVDLALENVKKAFKE